MLRKQPTHSTVRGLRLWLLVGVVGCLFACGTQESSGETGTATLAPDSAAYRFVQSIQARVAQGQRPTPSEVQRWKELALQYPEDQQIEELHVSLMLGLEDWEGITAYFEAKPDLEEEERFTMTRAYLRQADYQSAREVIQKHAATHPSDLEAQRLLARASYFLGDYESAARAYDNVWDGLMAQGKTTDLAYRAMIHFDEGEAGQAMEILTAALEATPNSIAVLSSISRILAAQGNLAEADRFSDRVATIQAAFGEEMAAKERRASQVYALNQALNAGRFEECEALVLRFLPGADDAYAEELYLFLERLYRKLGREAEMADVLSRARAVRNP